MGRCHFLGLVLQFGFATCFRSEQLQPQCGDVQLILDDILYLSTPNLRPGTVFPFGEYCTWTVISPANTKIKLIFESFVLEYHPTCAIDYVTISNGNCDNKDSDGPRFCGVVPPPMSISATNVICLKFASSMYTTEKGFILKADSLTGITEDATTKASVKTADVIIKASVITEDTTTKERVTTEGATIKASITTDKPIVQSNLQTEASSLVHLLTTYNSPLAGLKTTFKTKLGSLNLSATSAMHHSTTSISSSGRLETIELCNVTGTFLAYNDIFVTSPNFGDNQKYPVNTICTTTFSALVGYKMKIEFIHFDIEGNNLCSWDSLQVFDGADESTKMIKNLCGTSLPDSFISTGNELCFKFVSDNIIPRSGWKAKISIIKADVNTQPTSTSSDTNTNFASTVTPFPQSEIDLSTLSSASRSTRRKDSMATLPSITTTNHSSSGSIGKTDSTVETIPISITPSTQPPSFSAFSSSVPAFVPKVAEMCSTNESVSVVENFLHLTSPGFDEYSMYPTSILCTVSLHANIGSKLEISFLHFDVEGNSLCSWDSLQIFDGANDTGTLLGKLCGSSLPGSLASTGRYLFLKFVSDEIIAKTGFKAKINLVQGVDEKPTTEPGTITSVSPATPKLTTRTSSSLSVITFLHTLYSSVSSTHHTKVMFASAFGSTTTILANTPSVSSTSVQSFQAEKVDMCSVEKLTIYKSITVLSPKDNDTGMYPTSIICGLTIISKSSALHIEFEQLDIEYQQQCMWDYLEIYDGPSTKSPLKSRYCGSDIPPPIQTSGKEVSFRFQSDHIIPLSGFKLNISLINNSPGLDEQTTSECTQKYLNTYSPLFCVKSRSKTVSSSNKPTIVATPAQSSVEPLTPAIPAQFSMEPLTPATPSYVLKEPSDVSTTATREETIHGTTKEFVWASVDVNQNKHNYTEAVTPNSQGSTVAVTPNNQGSTIAVTSNNQGSTEYVTPNNHSSTEAVTPNNQGSTIAVTLNNQGSTEYVTPNSQSSTEAVTTKNPDSTEAVTPNNQGSTGFVTPDNQIYTEALTPNNQGSTEAVTPNNQGSTKALTPNNQGNTEALTPNNQGSTKALTPNNQGYTEALTPNKQGYTEALTPKNQGYTEALTPNNQGYTETLTPNNQGSTEALTPNNQGYTEALTPNNQGYTEALTPNNQGYTEALTPNNLGSTESVTTNNQSSTNTYKHITTPVTNSTQTTIGISDTQLSTPSLGFGLPQACSGDGMNIRNPSGIIDSPGLQNDKKYPHSVNCTWIILGLTGNRISVHFEAFELEESNNCIKDSVTVYKNSIQDSNLLGRYCGLLEPFEIYTMGETLLIHFTTDEDGSERGFMAKYTIGTPPAKIADCPVWQRACMEGTCISEEWFCDSIEDCAGGEDEANCAICSDTQFQCDYNRCIPAKQRCNGIQDCQDTTDEDFCVSITNINGSLRIMYENKWYPVCGVGWTTALGHALCKMAEYREMASVSFFPLKVNKPMILIKSISNIHQNIEISGKCPDAGEVNLICKESGCGTKSKSIRKARVVGGDRSAPGEWPWVVAIRAGEKVTCGGTLISNQWVVTAGHCMASLQDSTHLASVMVGTNNVMTDDSYAVGVTEIVMHPDYEFIYNADLALLRLQRPLVISYNVRPVCLPWDRRRFTNSTLCYIAGWGITDMKDYYTTTAPEYLHHARTKIWRESDCRKVYSSKVKDSMFCAGYKAGGIDACKGDSGGPLMCQMEDNRWVLTGVTSWGEKCGQLGFPGVYTDVASYLDWIDSVMGYIVVNVSCDFESVNICGYLEMSNGSFLWTRRPGGFSSDIKPSVDATNGVNGHYVFAEVSPGQTCNNNQAVLLSPPISGDTQKCLRFAFMFSGRSDLVLSVYGHRGDYNETGLLEESELLWVMRSEFGTWRRSKTSLPDSVTHVAFVVTLGIKTNVGVALDDVFFESSSCADQDAFRCSFDDGTLCRYQQATDDYLDWVLQSTATEAGYKVIPKSSWSGYYLEFGGSQIARGDKATIISTTINDSLPHCLNMYYKIYPRLSGSLSVILRVEFGGMHVYGDAMWTTRESRMSTWTWVAVDLPSRMYGFRVAIQGKRESYTGDFEILVDDVYIYEGNCKVTNFYV